VDTGSIMMQAFANRQAVKHTLQTGKARCFRRTLLRRPDNARVGYVLDALAAAPLDQGRVVQVRTLRPSGLHTPQCCRSNFIHVTSVHVDCDGDSLIYLGVPDGPSCHTVRSGSTP